MTKKQKLIQEYLSLIIEKNAGDTSFDITKYYQFKPEYLCTKTIAELESSVQYLKNYIEKKNHEQKVEAYFSTEEGAELKNELLASIEHEEKNFLETILLHEGFIKNKLWQRLGHNWTVHLSMGITHATIEIGLKNDDEKKPDAVFKFGHAFSIYVGKKWHTHKDYTLEVSYGSMGSFNPEENKQRVEYLLGLGKLVSDTEFLQYVKDTVVEVLNICKEIGDELTQYRDKLKNPFN